MSSLFGLAIFAVVAFFAFQGLARINQRFIQDWRLGGSARKRVVGQLLFFVVLSATFFLFFDIRNGALIGYFVLVGVLLAGLEYFVSEKDRELQEKEERRRYEEKKARLATGEDWTKSDVLDKFRTTLFFRRRWGVTTTLGWRCGVCGKNLYRRDEASLDHIKPVSKHPELRFSEENLQILCRPCNSTKSAYVGDDWKDVTRARRRVLKKKKNFQSGGGERNE